MMSMEKINNIKEEKPIFAKGWCFAKIFFMFFIGCIIGTYYEEILNYVRNGIWESRQGIIYGTFNPIYGFGFAGFALLLGKNNESRPWWKTYLYSCLIGGIAEYSLSYIGEILFHANAWDYSNMPLNIGGRTPIPFMLFWGLGGLVFMRLVYPFLSKLIEMIPYKIGKIMLPILVIFMSLNMFVSYTALFRQAQRLEGNPPLTFLGEFYDLVYTDEFLSKIYANLNHDQIGENPD